MNYWQKGYDSAVYEISRLSGPPMRGTRDMYDGKPSDWQAYDDFCAGWRAAFRTLLPNSESEGMNL